MQRSLFRRVLTDESGFTLIELLGVALILIVLSVLAFPVYAEVTDKTREAKSMEQLRVIEQALEAYRADPAFSHYPNNLQALVDKGFLKPSPFQTPWSGEDNRVYFYYAVDKSGAATRYVLGDAGPGVACGSGQAVNPCGKDPKETVVDPSLTWNGPWKLVRKSH